MTDELKKEWDVTYQTALGRSCEDREPSEEQKRAAKKEADEHIAELKRIEWSPMPGDILGTGIPGGLDMDFYNVVLTIFLQAGGGMKTQPYPKVAGSDS